MLCTAIGNSIGMTPPAATDTSDNGSIPPTDDATRPHGDNGDGAITSGAGGTFTSGNDETSLRERDAEPTGGSIKQVKAVLIPMGAVAVILLIIIGVLCCIKQVPSTPSSNSSGSAEGIRRPFQSSMNNPGYEGKPGVHVCIREIMVWYSCFFASISERYILEGSAGDSCRV